MPARTSPTLLPPSPRTVLSLSCFKVSQCINCCDWHFKRVKLSAHCKEKKVTLIYATYLSGSSCSLSTLSASLSPSPLHAWSTRAGSPSESDELTAYSDHETRSHSVSAQYAEHILVGVQGLKINLLAFNGYYETISTRFLVHSCTLKYLQMLNTKTLILYLIEYIRGLSNLCHN